MDVPIDFFIRAGRNDTVDALRDYGRRRLSFALRRFAHRLNRVTVRLIDLNGPRKGVDSRCSIAADLTDGRRLFVEATAAWPFAAVRQAATRLNEAARRDSRRHAAHRCTSARPFVVAPRHTDR